MNKCAQVSKVVSGVWRAQAVFRSLALHCVLGDRVSQTSPD